jgi:SOS response regulatory protein OraA/RecX
MPTLTALRRSGPGRVALEVDGHPWRAVPDDVVVRCGLHAGLTLDRPRLRLLRTELRRAEALQAAGRALARAPLSRRRLAERLHSRGVTPAAGRDAVGTLTAAGLVDDGRLARERAHALADGGWGNLAILARLERAGFGDDDVRNALASLAPEHERAEAAAAKLGRPRRRAWGALAQRGFSPEALEDALGSLDADGEPG